MMRASGSGRRGPHADEGCKSAFDPETSCPGRRRSDGDGRDLAPNFLRQDRAAKLESRIDVRCLRPGKGGEQEDDHSRANVVPKERLHHVLVGTFMERMRRYLGLLVLPLLQTCAANGHNGIRPLRPLELATAPYDGIVTSAFAGSLMFEGGCLLFREADTSARLFPVWPSGSIFNGTSVIFHEPGKAEQPILIAQQFVMEGRALPWTGFPGNIYAPFRHQCASQPFLVSKVRPAD
jgi:hypothetical protein